MQKVVSENVLTWFMKCASFVYSYKFVFVDYS
jgi:hypothetical protein